LGKLGDSIIDEAIKINVSTSNVTELSSSSVDEPASVSSSEFPNAQVEVQEKHDSIVVPPRQPVKLDSSPLRKFLERKSLAAISGNR